MVVAIHARCINRELCYVQTSSTHRAPKGLARLGPWLELGLGLGLQWCYSWLCCNVGYMCITGFGRLAVGGEEVREDKAS